MVDFSDEQEAEVQRRVQEAARFEQWRVAFAQGYRLVVPYLQGLTDQYDPQTKQLIKQGAIDPFVFTVFKTECDKIISEYFPPAQKPEPAVKDDSDKE